MAPRLYKAAEVCELAQLQPYVLRSWEKEFPGIGVQKSQDSPRLYRQSDLDQVLRIKQLVFGEGLTLSGARKRLEESAPAVSAASQEEAAQVLVEAIGADARARIARVRDGLRSILALLSAPVGTVVLATEPSVEEYQLEPPASPTVRAMTPRSRTPPASKTPAAGKRKRASA